MCCQLHRQRLRLCRESPLTALRPRRDRLLYWGWGNASPTPSPYRTRPVFVTRRGLFRRWCCRVRAADDLDLKSAMLPEWSSQLANLYYRKRYCREHDHACRRKAWRKIAVEKKRLLSEGVEYIELHLVCRYLTNTGNRNAVDRLRTYLAQGRLFG